MTGAEHILWEQEKIGNDFLFNPAAFSYQSCIQVPKLTLS